MCVKTVQSGQKQKLQAPQFFVHDHLKEGNQEHISGAENKWAKKTFPEEHSVQSSLANRKLQKTLRSQRFKGKILQISMAHDL